MALKYKILDEPLDLKAYTLDAGCFSITAYTPVLFAKAQAQNDLLQAQHRYNRRGKKIRDVSFDPTGSCAHFGFLEVHRGEVDC
jgi:hypothetical protein